MRKRYPPIDTLNAPAAAKALAAIDPSKIVKNSCFMTFSNAVEKQMGIGSNAARLLKDW